MSIMKNLSLYTFAVLAMVGCSKERDNESGPDTTVPRMIFESTQQSTRAHFSFDTGDLVWDDYDNIGAYSFAGGGHDLLTYGFCEMGLHEGDKALFNSDKARADWVGGRTEGNVTFYAYYPQQTVPVAACTDGKVDLNVGWEQWNEFGKYQICCSDATTLPVSEILDATKPVNFNFTPATSMIRVHLTLSAESSMDQLTINRLLMTVYKHDEQTNIVGNRQLSLADGTLTPRTGPNRNTKFGDCAAYVRLVQGVTITKNREDNPYINVVVVPAAVQGKVIAFQALTLDDKLLSSQLVSAPADFKRAKRHNIDLTYTAKKEDWEADYSTFEPMNAKYSSRVSRLNPCDLPVKMCKRELAPANRDRFAHTEFTTNVPWDASFSMGLAQ